MAPVILRSFLLIQLFSKGYIYVRSIPEPTYPFFPLFKIKSYNALGIGLSIFIKGFYLLLNTHITPTFRYKKMNVKELASYR